MKKRIVPRFSLAVLHICYSACRTWNHIPVLEAKAGLLTCQPFTRMHLTWDGRRQAGTTWCTLHCSALSISSLNGDCNERERHELLTGTNSSPRQENLFLSYCMGIVCPCICSVGNAYIYIYVCVCVCVCVSTTVIPRSNSPYNAWTSRRMISTNWYYAVWQTNRIKIREYLLQPSVQVKKWSVVRLIANAFDNHCDICCQFLYKRQ